MPGLIDDEVVDLYATIGTYGDIARRLVERYGGIATSLEFSVPVASGDDRTSCPILSPHCTTLDLSAPNLP